jgi:Domain of unknown function (DUF4287)
MADIVEKAIATQLANIEKRSGKTLAELVAIVKASGLAKHGEIRDMLKRELGLGHGDANTLTHHALKSDGASAAAAADLSSDDVVAGLYVGAKAALRPIHDQLMKEINQFGAFETLPGDEYTGRSRPERQRPHAHRTPHRTPAQRHVQLQSQSVERQRS